MNEVINNKILKILSEVTFNYSIIFKDLQTEKFLSWTNSNVSIDERKSPSASTIKVFIAIEAFSQINKSKLSADMNMVLEDNMKVGGAGILNTYPSGFKISVNKLICLMLTESDNTATNILIDLLGMDNINNNILSLGITNSSLNRKMMDFEAKAKGLDNYSSALDLAKVLEMLYNGSCINDKYDNLILNIMKDCSSNRKITNKLPKEVVVAHKTGELPGIENDAGIIYTPKGNYIISCFTQGESNKDQALAISNISKEFFDLY